MDSQDLITNEYPNVADSATQTWSVLAHLLFMIGFVIPFGGIIALLVLHLTLGKRNSNIRKHSLAALNVEITSWASLAVSALGTLAVWILAATFGFLNISSISNSSGLTLLLGLAGILFMSLAFLFTIYHVVAGIMNAIEASNGKNPKYSYSISFIPS